MIVRVMVHVAGPPDDTVWAAQECVRCGVNVSRDIQVPNGPGFQHGDPPLRPWPIGTWLAFHDDGGLYVYDGRNMAGEDVPYVECSPTTERLDDDDAPHRPGGDGTA